MNFLFVSCIQPVAKACSLNQGTPSILKRRNRVYYVKIECAECSEVMQCDEIEQTSSAEHLIV